MGITPGSSQCSTGPATPPPVGIQFTKSSQPRLRRRPQATQPPRLPLTANRPGHETERLWRPADRDVRPGCRILCLGSSIWPLVVWQSVRKRLRRMQRRPTTARDVTSREHSTAVVIHRGRSLLVAFLAYGLSNNLVCGCPIVYD